MTTFGGLELGLSVLFACLLLAVIAELYYLFCWRKSNPKTFFDCFKKHKNHQLGDSVTNPIDPESQLSSSKELLLKEESIETELMRLHNLSGPPRFLFTIKEETKEDLESNDGKSRKGSRTRSLSDLINSIETPYLSPLSSPPIRDFHGLNPLFEAEMSLLRSSPPPTFKFMRDAEEKMYRRFLIDESENKGVCDFVFENKENKNEVDEYLSQCYSSSSSQDLEMKKTIGHGRNEGGLYYIDSSGPCTALHTTCTPTFNNV